MTNQIGHDFGVITPDQLTEAERYHAVVTWSDDDQVFLAEIQEIPGVKAHGATRAEAAEMVVEATALWLQSARKRVWTIPAPRSVTVAS